ncbi:transporter substrate-binding domain-containing protein [Fusobacterium mortiferum]|uniref:Transporter substrate-binding domain-containing protein n=1 Tax=Fusobacterium mortiferum TaxID=850 RepID=A0ABS2G495_FUSMR|nr:transporter substrate-binding domain-containing protein [Fusobacterium mortiferum]MBM6876239.1 transporter substrate-binding domain-containing protein [Fusobacterium mortiferum]
MKSIYNFLKIMLFIFCCFNTFGAEKVYKIATDINFPPFEFRDKNGNLKGIDIELLEALSKDQNFKYELLELGFYESLKALNSGEVDAIFSAMAITEERKEKYDFSSPYIETGIILAVEKNSPIKSYKDLKGKIVTAKRGTIGSKFVAELAQKYKFQVMYLEDSLNLVNDVAKRLSHACFEDSAFIKYNIANGINIKTPIKEEKITECGVMVLKGENKELIEKINNGLVNLRANGVYDKIIAKYLNN